MINEKHFQEAILGRTVTEGGKKTFELAKQMTKDFAQSLTNLPSEDIDKAFSEYSGTPASSLAQEAEGKGASFAIAVHSKGFQTIITFVKYAEANAFGSPIPTVI